MNQLQRLQADATHGGVGYPNHSFTDAVNTRVLQPWTTHLYLFTYFCGLARDSIIILSYLFI